VAKDDEEETTPVKPTKPTKKKAAPAAEEPQVGSDSESEGEEEVQILATEVDPDNENAPAEGDAVYKPGQPVGTIPDVSQAVEKAAKAKHDGEPGVIYIGRIPHGFYEHEMRAYFSQFGPINKLRLSRNKKTGASKHFAFIEFAEASTADIVAKTMDNYLLFGHILKCRTIPKEQVHDDLFKGANRRFKKVPWNKIVGRQLEKPLSEAAWEKRVAKEQSRRSKKATKLQALGYEFEAPEIKEIPPPAPVPEIEQEEVKVIEAPTTEGAEDEQVEVVEKVTEAPGVKVVEKSISAPKPKTRATRSKKAKA
jgi:nucleolar protein 15